MRASLLILLLALPAAAQTPAAQTPAERAGALLEQGVARDRSAEATAPVPTAVPPPAAGSSARDLDQDRRSLAPDVGRPEATGQRIPGPAGTGEASGSNPQR